AGVRAQDVGAIAVATPGLVDDGRIRLAPSLPGWNAVDLPAHLRRTVDCPVILDNDANMAALAVSNNRGGAETVIAVQWGERIGGGVVINGRLHRRASAAAGGGGFIPPRTTTPTSPAQI